jgi:hypothetical protein
MPNPLLCICDPILGENARFLKSSALNCLDMSYRTLVIEIDHGKVTAKEEGQLPDKATGFFTILPPAHATGQKSVLEALEALQSYLRVNEETAANWMATVNSARR